MRIASNWFKREVFDRISGYQWDPLSGPLDFAFRALWVPRIYVYSPPNKSFLFRIGCVVASLQEYNLCPERPNEGNVRDSKQAALQQAEELNEAGSSRE